MQNVFTEMRLSVRIQEVFLPLVFTLQQFVGVVRLLLRLHTIGQRLFLVTGRCEATKMQSQLFHDVLSQRTSACRLTKSLNTPEFTGRKRKERHKPEL